MKKISIFLTVLLFSYQLQAQVGKPFPLLYGETLEGKVIELPIQTKGKFTLLGLAYSKGAESELLTWYQPIYSTFIEKPKPGLFNESYDVNMYFVPMFTGVNQAASNTAKKKMKEGVDPVLHPYIMFYKGELAAYKESLNFEKRDTPYFFVLDKNGNIIHAFTGKYSAEKLAKIEELISE